MLDPPQQRGNAGGRNQVKRLAWSLLLLAVLALAFTASAELAYLLVHGHWDPLW